MLFSRFVFSLLTLISFLVLVGRADAAPRVALVIGNSAYTNTTALPNTTNDARALAEKLAEIGFEVMLRNDLDGQAFRIALGEFREKALGAELALFYYAGHGIELEGQNYLIPVDAQMQSEATAVYETVPLEQAVQAVDASSKLGLVLIDACRDNPFNATMRRINGQRSITRGLAPVSVDAGSGLLISFAAESGNTAADGTGEHSPYATAILDVIDEPGLEIGRMFRSVRARVREATDGQQNPVELAQLPDEDVYLVPAVAVAAAPVVAPAVVQTAPAVAVASQAPVPPTVAEPVAPAVQPEPKPAQDAAPAPTNEDPLLVFLLAQQQRDIAALESFVARYPDHVMADDATALIDSIKEDEFWRATLATNDDNAIRNYLLAYPSGKYVERAGEVLAEMRSAPATAARGTVALTLADLGSCPAISEGLPGTASVNLIMTDKTLTLRSGPGVSYPATAELPYNSTGVTMQSCAGGWCETVYGCTSGYAPQANLTKGETIQWASAFAGLYNIVNQPAGSKLAVRSGPDGEYAQIATLPSQAEDIEVLDCQARPGARHRWCFISWNQVSGWVYGDALLNLDGRSPMAPGLVEVFGARGSAEPELASQNNTEQCFALWYERSAILDAAGYCFPTEKGNSYFNNADCYTSAPSVSVAHRDRILAIQAEESQLACPPM